jgi:CHAT domain-containing protein
VQYGWQSAELKPLTSEVLLNQKGIVYEILTNRSRQMKSGGTTLQDSLNSIRAQLANAYFTDPANIKNPELHLRYLQFLQAQQERLENQLAHEGYESETPKTPITPTQLCQSLPEDYALVDFWYFPKYNFVGEKKGWGTRQYLAVVYQKNDEPEILQLGEADSLHNRLSELRQAILSTKLDPTHTEQQHLTVEAVIKAKGRQLYQRLFKPLLSAIGDKKKVIICADGALHYLPFGVMVDEHDRYLLESYQFHYVSTGRDILQWNKKSLSKGSQPVIIADPDFNFTSSQQITFFTPSKPFSREFLTHSSQESRQISVVSKELARRSRDWRQMGFSQLKYTGPEAVAIDSLLKQKGIATKLYLQDQAQESVLKSVVSPQILHISTHGFFLPDQPELRKPKEIGGFSSIGEFDRTPALENPLLRCGLAFAGANHAESVKEGEDGLATAMEIAGLDLQGYARRGTDLVTLSACLTGVGELRSGEGVYGLHRSFLLAGAKTVLASLWSVPDLETKDLMVEFYRRYLFGENISKSEALRQAQLAVIEQLRKKYGASGLLGSVCVYWGAVKERRAEGVEQRA